MSLTNKHRKQKKGLSQTFSKINKAKDDKQQQKINEPEEEIRKLKTTQNITTETTNIDQTKMNNPPQQNLKKRKVAFAKKGGQKENINLLEVISFVEKTMKTLSNYGERLKIQLDFNSTQ